MVTLSSQPWWVKTSKCHPGGCALSCLISGCSSSPRCCRWPSRSLIKPARKEGVSLGINQRAQRVEHRAAALKPIWCARIDCSPGGSAEPSGCRVNADLICITVSENWVGSLRLSSPDAECVLRSLWRPEEMTAETKQRLYLYCTYCLIVFPTRSKHCAEGSSSQKSWDSACLFGCSAGCVVSRRLARTHFIPFYVFLGETLLITTSTGRST